MLTLKSMTKYYNYKKRNEYCVLNDINFQIHTGEFVAILGKSGHGKTTLLNVLGGLDQFQSGELYINSYEAHRFSSKNWEDFRKSNIGFLYQDSRLIKHLTVLENVSLPLIFLGESEKVAKHKAKNALSEVGIEADLYNRYTSELSVGQEHRVALARSFIHNPIIILADEPTGSLDKANSIVILNLLKKLSKDKIVIITTHNEKLANQYATRIIQLEDGMIVNDRLCEERNEHNENNNFVQTEYYENKYKKQTIMFKSFLKYLLKYNKLYWTKFLANFITLCIISVSIFLALNLYIISQEKISSFMQYEFNINALYLNEGEVKYMDKDLPYTINESYNQDDISKLDSIKGVEYVQLGSSISAYDNENNTEYYIEMLLPEEKQSLQIDESRIVGSLPKTKGEILISKYLAESMYPNQVYEDLIGRSIFLNINLDASMFTISGVYNVDKNKNSYYEYITPMTYQEIIEEREYIFSKRERINGYINIGDIHPIELISYSNLIEVLDDESLLVGRLPENKNEILLPSYYLNTNLGSSDIESWYNLYVDNHQYRLKVVGYYNSQNSVEVIMLDSAFKDINIYKFNNKLIIYFNDYYNMSKQLNTIKSMGYQINNRKMSEGFTFIDVIESIILSLKIINIVLILISIFILNIFIKYSIISRQKEFGILNTIGISKRNIEKIVYYNYLVTSIISSVIGLIIYGLLINGINGMINNHISLNITVFRFNFMIIIFSLIVFNILIYVFVKFNFLSLRKVHPVNMM